MKIASSTFECSVTSTDDEPRAPGADVVFLGRSNVGKSSLINRLLGVSGLARTSSRPGRTQTVNFYRINDSFYFVDLPGYGYAKVPEAIRRQWGPMIESFLERRRERIAVAVLVVDARHEPTKLDGVMQEWLEQRKIPWIVVATKSDKLSGNGRTRSMTIVKRFATAPALMVSAENGTGVKELWKHLDQLLAAA